MKIGIIGAMDIEIQLLRKHLINIKETKISNFSFYEGKIQNHEVIVLLSGIGKVSASVGTALLINTFSPDLVINTGTAGGLRTSSVYDLILATEVSYYDVDVTAVGYKLGQQAQMPPVFLPDQKWLEIARQNCLKFTKQLHSAPIVSGDSFISNPEKKHWIEEKFPNALAVEMEAAAIAQTCYLMNTPFLVLRAISDSAGEGNTISYEAFVEQAGSLSAKMNINLIESL